ncbi:hypothetical protein NDU88_000583 [Pleurodeles waltl]|uniref:Uncharacterized protein n=1 Tax=Pleurodeles waltl TaxID=8319 RepID=A0AAV7WL45_PLEWA|nr:hypothetical protein NDU88_000583 [Pleurodeles waltl]
MPRKCQLWVQRSFYWTEEAEDSAGTKRARDFPFGGRIPLAVESRADVFSRRKNANKPCYLQIERLAFLDAAMAQEGPGGRKLDQEGEDSVDPQEISSELLVQRGGRLPPQHAPPGKQSRRRQDQRYRVAVVVFATMLQFCRLPARSAVDSLAEGEERDAEEL